MVKGFEVADDARLRFVELTSRPSREAANDLYRSLGFERRETNVARHYHTNLPGRSMVEGVADDSTTSPTQQTSGPGR